MHRRPLRRYAVLPAAALAALLGSCARETAPGPAATSHVARCDLNSPPSPPPPAAATAAAPGPATPVPGTAHVHNVFRLGPRVLTGSVPEGDAGFAELAAMGVRTVVSVDGASPAVELAAAHGLRYVHVPTAYSTVTDAQRLELARAVRDLPGPVYIHCHHGKHRGPAAAASVAVALGGMTPAEGVAYMKAAGTAPNYTGLYACVENAAPATTADVDSAPADFPSVRRPAGLVAAMVEIDGAYERLGLVRAAGWTVPPDHPDLVPASEAGMLADHLRVCREDRAAAARGEAFAQRLADAVAEASALEESLAAGAAKDELEARWAPVAASCKDCHAAHRDRFW